MRESLYGAMADSVPVPAPTHRPRPLRHLLLVPAVLLMLSLLAGCGLGFADQVHPSVPPGVPGRVMRSVVDVHVRSVTGLTVEEGLGTGVIFNREGVIVTNDHVVDLDGRRGAAVSVQTLDGRTAPAVVVARFPGLDLAFLKVRLADLRPARFATSLDQVDPGDHVFAVGAPHHFRRAVVRGRVLRVLTDVVVQHVPGLRALLESSARLRRGFSGGPLADARGLVVGIDTASSLGPGPEAVSLSIPAPVVLRAAARAGLRPAGG